MNTTKICNVCFIEKDINDFKKAIENIDGRTKKCKQCYKDKLYHPDILYKPQEDHKLCKNCYAEKPFSEFYFRNKEKGTLQPYCKPCHKIKGIKDRIKHRDKRNKSQIKYEKERIKRDPIFKFKTYIRKTVKRAYKNFVKENRQSFKAEEILGCSLHYFIEYIEGLFTEGMTWENHGHCKIGDCNVWNIDHKIPLATAKTKEDTIKLNHYTNLQPMWAEENLIKGIRF